MIRLLAKACAVAGLLGGLVPAWAAHAYAQFGDIKYPPGFAHFDYVNPAAPFWSVLMVGLVFGLTNFPCVSTWAGFGVALREFLSDPRRLKWFNIAMALLLVASLWPMLT